MGDRQSPSPMSERLGKTIPQRIEKEKDGKKHNKPR